MVIKAIPNADKRNKTKPSVKHEDAMMNLIGTEYSIKFKQ